MRCARAVADTSATVLIRGESGVGKEYVARFIHQVSSRRDHPFVKVNCAALPEPLLEAELFGHEKGAFTGALQRTPGCLETAGEGTLLLDEIGDIPLSQQPKLLHVLEDREYSRVGGHQPLRLAARVVAATNHPLEAAVARGNFRQDLYYRLDVVSIHVPPLRERPDDIPVLAERLLERFGRRYQRETRLSTEGLGRLMAHSWPGNVRELENMLGRLVLLGEARALAQLARPGGPAVAAGAEVAAANGDPAPGRCAATLAGRSLSEIGRQAAREAERAYIARTLERMGWNRAQAARRLRISYKALRHKISDYGLTPGAPGGERSQPPLAVAG